MRMVSRLAFSILCFSCVLAIAHAEGMQLPQAPSRANRDTGTVLHTVNLVPVVVVIRDDEGRVVGNLHQENFRLFDEGKPQTITHFFVGSTVSGIPPADSGSASAHPQREVQPGGERNLPANVGRATAYVFDDVHSSFADLAEARDAAAPHLRSLPTGESAAIFSISGSVTVDFTSDREQLLAGLRRLQPRAILPENFCAPISPYLADLMLNKQDPVANNVAVEEMENCGALPGPDAIRKAQHEAIVVLDAGTRESKDALDVLKRVVRRIEPMPGQLSIVLVSPGFLALSPDMDADVAEIIDAAVHAGIIINTLDAHGLYNYAFSVNSVPDPAAFQLAMAEVRAREDVMSAFAGGGIFFHNNNNLDEGFRRTADLPEFVYVLGFSPQKLDGRFHKLKVKLKDGAKFNVQARVGYYAPKTASAK